MRHIHLEKRVCVFLCGIKWKLYMVYGGMYIKSFNNIWLTKRDYFLILFTVLARICVWRYTHCKHFSHSQTNTLILSLWYLWVCVCASECVNVCLHGTHSKLTNIPTIRANCILLLGCGHTASVLLFEAMEQLDWWKLLFSLSVQRES